MKGGVVERAGNILLSLHFAAPIAAHSRRLRHWPRKNRLWM